MQEKLIFEKSVPGRRAVVFPELDVPAVDLDSLIPKEMQRKEPAKLPEVSENEVVRHFTRLSQMNFGVDTGFYPLGSCTMKYNPKINEETGPIGRLCPAASLPTGKHRAGSACSSCMRPLLICQK